MPWQPCWACATICLVVLSAAAWGQEAWDAAVICRGSEAEGAMAFPDICRLKNGELLCVFYSGYGHGTPLSEKWPGRGRIIAIRSSDEGNTWSRPTVIMDTPDDDRDPSVTCLPDGTVLMNWFSAVHAKPPADDVIAVHLLLSRSADGGHTWGEAEEIKIPSKHQFACSSPIRQLPDGSLMMGLYCESGNGTFGATIRSNDGGRTWKDLATIGEKAGLYLDAETDVVTLKDGRLLAALRSSDEKGKGMYVAESSDQGKTWGPVRPLGFHAHCPYFLRHSSGVILLGVRHLQPPDKNCQTSLYWTADEGKTWTGPVMVDYHGGAYPSMVELANHEVYCVYYDGGDAEGRGSNISGKHLRVTTKGVEVLPVAKH